MQAPLFAFRIRMVLFRFNRLARPHDDFMMRCALTEQFGFCQRDRRFPVSGRPPARRHFLGRFAKKLIGPEPVQTAKP